MFTGLNKNFQITKSLWGFLKLIQSFSHLGKPLSQNHGIDYFFGFFFFFLFILLLFVLEIFLKPRVFSLSILVLELMLLQHLPFNPTFLGKHILHVLWTHGLVETVHHLSKRLLMENGAELKRKSVIVAYVRHRQSFCCSDGTTVSL